MQVKCDRKLLIAIGRSRKASQWQNKEMLWSEFLDKLATTTRTRETVAEYAAMPKGERDTIKDVGGFVSGYLKNGRRNNASVVNRCMLCLDADNADPGLMDDLDMTFINAYALYSTHSHTPEKMRLRLIIPLTRTVTPDEYAAVSRRVADDLGLSRFDPTTFEPARLMYWPSTPEDGEFFFHCEDAPFLDPDEVLKTYADWRDASLWPTTQPVEERIRHTAGKQEDPTEKRGIIGAFCRAHTITDVLTHILHDRYTPTEQDDRYTFVGGSTTGGLVVYDDKYAFSHHATDPAGGKLCNAFDLVRWHLFTPVGTAPDGSMVGDEKSSINIPFTNEHFVAFCEKMLGQPYWYGAVVYKCTESLRARKAKQYPAHYGSSRTARYRDDIAKKKVCADCVGLIKGYQWTNGGQGVIESIGTDKTFSSKYGGHGCPDKSANGMFSYAKSKGCAWGTMDTLPDVPGIALRFDGHVGVYIGGGYAVEERGFNYGCVKTKVSSRKWTHWYQLPFVDYGDAMFTGGSVTKPDTPASEYTLGTRTLKKGSKGTDVKALQEFLLQLGYSLPRYGSDGDFGGETETAIKRFQARAGLAQDGVYGGDTHKALMDAVADHDAGKEAAEPDEPSEPSAARCVRIVCDGGTVNIRVGNGTQYDRITAARNGSTFEWVATAENGWHAIVVNGRVGWVSGKYAKLA